MILQCKVSFKHYLALLPSLGSLVLWHILLLVLQQSCICDLYDDLQCVNHYKTHNLISYCLIGAWRHYRISGWSDSC